MLLLIIYISLALGFSFLCSVAEAVLLSVSTGYIAVLEQEKKSCAMNLRKLKEDINKPLAAILTLNTIAHTVGAAGAGAQASAVFGSAYLGLISGILTLLILVFSEIIPKTIGAHYWRQLAPATTYFVTLLVWVLYPFVRLSQMLTRSITDGPGLKGFNRDEFAALARMSWEDGLLEKRESKILTNLLSMHGLQISEIMTPESVLFTIDENMSIGEYCENHQSERFSRIPVYKGSTEDIRGFVLLNELLLAQTRGESARQVSEFRRELTTVLGTFSLHKVFDKLLQQRAHILLVVDEYGKILGILTLEDALEAILGLEIVDESDTSRNMQELARRFWRRRVKQKGLDLDAEEPGGNDPEN